MLLSPKYSFVDFEGRITDFILPVYRYFSHAFQFIFPSTNTIPIATPVQIAIADKDNNVVYSHASHVAVNIAAWAKFDGINFTTDFPLTVDYGYIVPDGVYATKEDFLEALKSIGLNALDETFLQPVGSGVADIYFECNAGTKIAHIKFYKGLQQVTITEDANSDFEAHPVIAIDDCFRFAVLDPLGAADDHFSNLFKRVSSKDYLTEVTYSCNEDAYEFYYITEDLFNRVTLPVFVKFPKYPEQRKIYIKSNKQYKVLNSSIEREWELVTDYVPDSIHQRIVVMLGHDNVHLKGVYAINSIDGDVFKKDEYDIDWQDRVDFAMAKCKLLETFSGRNSNCEKRTEPADICGNTIGAFTAARNGGHFEWTWTNSPGIADNYLIAISTDGGATWTNVDFQIDVTATYGLSDDPMPNVACIFRITPFCSGGVTGTSAKYTYTP